MTNFIELASDRSIRDELRAELDSNLARLFARCGLGLHLDSSAADYGFSGQVALDHDLEISEVFRLADELDLEPYEEALKLFKA